MMNNRNVVLLASDHGGFILKEKIKPYLAKLKLETRDLGAYSRESCDYPEFAAAVAEDISRKKYSKGIIICKSGIGNSIVANRFPGVRAALVYSVKAARLSRMHNDSNVLVLGSSFVSLDLARRIIAVWLKTQFEGGRHRRRLGQLKKIEEGIRK